jgi:hypothetical protein
MKSCHENRDWGACTMRGVELSDQTRYRLQTMFPVELQPVAAVPLM